MDDIERVVEQLELENDKQAASNPLVKKSLDIVEEFLKTHPVMCYGGTAINNLIPPEDRFYDPTYDIPDYDFFSRTPQEHAMMLANKLYSAGIKSVEVKPGMHLGTFKVFADYEGVADITHLDVDVFDRLWADNVVKNDIHYVTPNFLRMSMYLELSRPRGDVSRWTKVYKRLTLLNKHYPLTCPGVSEEQTILDDEKRKEVESILRKHKVVLLGVTASQIHQRKDPTWVTPVTLLAEKDKIPGLVGDRKHEEFKGTDILPTHTDVLDEDGKVFLRIYETAACHSYHETRAGIKVASIPTILQFFFAYIYSGVEEDEISHILCVAQRLMDLAHEKPKRRFALLTPVDCLGVQHTLVDIRKDKAEQYEKLSKDKSSAEFLKFFFTYSPSLSKTQRERAREQLHKTRKARYESSY
jgi:hypothetical protein